ncbi:extracellular solute-binding protein [Pelagibacteraceae bacterium]|nr:extracellular solute-binding protein [Pelagibacteraceae bacterium]
MKKIFLIVSVIASIAFSTAPTIAAEKVTVYTAVPQVFIDELVPMFEKQTGINVEIIKAGSGELLNRLTAEAARPMADVLWSVDSSVVDFNPTLFEVYAPAGTDALLEGISDSEKASPFSAVVMAFIVNESKLDGLPIPQSWLELSDPKYDDYISSAKANRSGSSYIQLATVLQGYGEERGWEIYKGLLANYVLSDSSGAVPRFVNDGELAIGVTLEDAVLRFMQGGGPVQIVYPSDGTAFHADAMALVAGAPNEGNGKAFLDFMMSSEAQTIVAEQGRRPVRGDVPSNPALVPANELIRVDYNNAWAAENRKRIVSAWEDMLLDVQ